MPGRAVVAGRVAPGRVVAAADVAAGLAHAQVHPLHALGEAFLAAGEGLWNLQDLDLVEVGATGHGQRLPGRQHAMARSACSALSGPAGHGDAPVARSPSSSSASERRHSSGSTSLVNSATAPVIRLTSSTSS